jgi:hypothetical protein
MSIRRVAALQVGFLLVAILANAASRNTMRITVLDSVTRAVPLDNNGVPTNCDGTHFRRILPFHYECATSEHLARAGWRQSAVPHQLHH